MTVRAVAKAPLLSPRSRLPAALGLALALAAALPGPGRAQDVEIPDFNTLATPPAPAWTLLGLEPSSVERPTNPTEFGVSLLQRSDNVATLPSDWAVEMAPYWTFGGPGGPWTADVERSVGEAFLRTLSVSFVTAQTGTDVVPVTSVGTAVRFQLLSGRVPETARRQAAALAGALTAFARSAEERAAELRRELNVDARFVEIRREFGADSANTWLRAQNDAIEVRVQESGDVAARRRAAEELQLNASVRHGFILEMAGGWGADIPRNGFDDLETRQWGVWASPSWIGSRASVVGVARYLSDPGLDRPAVEGAVDFGVRGILQRPRVGLSVEAVGRRLSVADGVADPEAPDRQDWRLAGIAEYRVDADWWVRATFGRDFDRSGEGGGLLATISVSLDVGGERYGPG